MNLYPFLVLAACGLVLSIVAHVLALSGTTIPGGQLVWGLHIGVCVVWIPTVLASLPIMRGADRRDFWKVALAGCPAWMRRAGYLLFGYAILNFILFMGTTAGQPKQRQTGAAPPSVVRGFSGHWMMFYGAAFGILYSRLHAPHLYRERKCPQGHPVPLAARFCPKCGYEFTHESEVI